MNDQNEAIAAAVAAEQQRCLQIALNEAASVLTGDGWLAAKRIARLIQNGTNP